MEHGVEVAAVWVLGMALTPLRGLRKPFQQSAFVARLYRREQFASAVAMRFQRKASE
jgi:hypothetical protein